MPSFVAFPSLGSLVQMGKLRRGKEPPPDLSSESSESSEEESSEDESLDAESSSGESTSEPEQEDESTGVWETDSDISDEGIVGGLLYAQPCCMPSSTADSLSCCSAAIDHSKDRAMCPSDVVGVWLKRN